MQAPPKKLLSVLVCEDDPLILYSTIELVRRMGHQATPAADARTALSILATKPVDILLTDVGLPEMSGAQLAEEALLQNPELAIIFASGQEQDRTLRRATGPSRLPSRFPMTHLPRPLLRPRDGPQIVISRSAGSS